MKGRVVFVSVCLLLAALTVSLSETRDQLNLTVHEWGTFTSIAGVDGAAVQWQAYGGPVDLPCFVHTFGKFKVGLSGSVRMETPVLYFYTSRPAVANVKIRFPRGTITEWYPQQDGALAGNSIEWRDVLITPDAKSDFPSGRGASHYYAARETDASPLQVGSEKEKFLFYRGVGTFPLPIAATVNSDSRIVVKNVGPDLVTGILLFENRGGKRRYHFEASLKDEMTVDSESLQDNWAGLLMDLERVLVEHGLYQQEARAMIETWRDSWFEEGTRLFYIVPRRAVDAVLPLDIQPTPLEVARVFVGRLEIVTPAVQEDVRDALAHNDRLALGKYARFLDPIAKRIGVKSALLNSVYAAYLSKAPSCV